MTKVIIIDKCLYCQYIRHELSGFFRKTHRYYCLNSTKTYFRNLNQEKLQTYRHNWDVQSLEVMPEHVHMLLAADPKWSCSEIMKWINATIGQVYQEPTGQQKIDQDRFVAKEEDAGRTPLEEVV